MRYISDGLEVVGFIIKPKDIKDKLPVMIYNRGGNREFGTLNTAYLTYLAYLSHEYGYAILASQYRGNDGGEGTEEFGGSDLNDVMNLIKLAEQLPYADADKIVMFGESHGGMMTYELCRQTDRIKAATVIGGSH